MYALVAAGYVFTYAVTRTFNFALWIVFSAGGLVAILLANASYPLWLAGVDGVVAGGFLGVVFDLIAMLPHRLRGRGSIESMVATVATAALCLSLWFDYSAFGFPNLRDWSRPLLHEFEVHAGSVTLPGPKLLAIAISVLTLLALQLLVRGTRIGTAMRAVAGNPAAAAAAGVNVGFVYAQSAFVGSALCAAGGVLAATLVANAGVALPEAIGPPLPVFAAVVFGGMTSLPGAIAAAYAVWATWSGVAAIVPGPGVLAGIALVIIAVVALLPRFGLFPKRALRAPEE